MDSSQNKMQNKQSDSLNVQVVAETDEPFVPVPDELIVNLKESREAVEALLDNLANSFAATTSVSTSHVLSVHVASLASSCGHLPMLLTRTITALLQPDSAMGPAVQSAYLMMEAIGGKLLLFQTSVPNVHVAMCPYY